MHSRAPVWRLDSPTMNHDYVRPPKTCSTTIARLLKTYLRPATTSYQLRQATTSLVAARFFNMIKNLPKTKFGLANTQDHPQQPGTCRGTFLRFLIISSRRRSQTVVSCRILQCDWGFKEPTSKRTWGDRSFSVEAPRLSNHLPTKLKSCHSMTRFKSLLKTHLMSQFFKDDVYL